MINKLQKLVHIRLNKEELQIDFSNFFYVSEWLILFGFISIEKVSNFQIDKNSNLKGVEKLYLLTLLSFITHLSSGICRVVRLSFIYLNKTLENEY